MIEQVLLIIGASIFGLLGTLHLLFTFFTNKFDAHDPNVTEAMKNTTPVLTKDTTLWDAWIGFNASHSLGAMLVAAFYIPLAAFHMNLIVDSKEHVLIAPVTQPRARIKTPEDLNCKRHRPS